MTPRRGWRVRLAALLTELRVKRRAMKKIAATSTKTQASARSAWTKNGSSAKNSRKVSPVLAQMESANFT